MAASIRQTAYLKAEGVHNEHTVPKTSEQNGVTERLNRALVETVRWMFIDFKLLHKVWAEALATASHTRNHSPPKTVDGMTPHEAWINMKPTVKQGRVFGCDALCTSQEARLQKQKVHPIGIWRGN